MFGVQGLGLFGAWVKVSVFTLFKGSAFCSPPPLLVIDLVIDLDHLNFLAKVCRVLGQVLRASALLGVDPVYHFRKCACEL